MILVYLVISLLMLELVIFCVVTQLRKKYSWIVTAKDELPEFDKAALQKFMDYSFDADLGWVRKPNSSGVDKGRQGDVTFHIDDKGARLSTLDYQPTIAAFGDSYTFCRQVEDGQTWEEQLALKEKVGVMNFGVGNYGIDQGLLRYEMTELPDTVNVVVMGFVPETICRVQSYWKHYLEFGNTFAFKPRFVLTENEGLMLVKSPMTAVESFQQLDKKLPQIKKIDRFYWEKFRALQFRFPYVLSLLRHPIRHTELLLSMLLSTLFNVLKISSSWSENLPFSVVMKNNLMDAHQLYSEKNSLELLNAIIRRFKQQAESRGHIPLLLVMPQLLDLRLMKGKNAPYHNYFQQISTELAVIDVTHLFAQANIENLYFSDQFGGHLSPEGNAIVAESISNWLKNRL